jgi:hypothetical protein
MNRFVRLIKTVSPLAVAGLAAAEVANHPDEVGAAIAEAAMAVPKFAEYVGETEGKLAHAVRERVEHVHPTHPPAHERPCHGLVPESPEFEGPEHFEMEP